MKFEEAVNNLSSLEDLDDEKMNNSLVETPPGEVSRDDISSLKKQLRDTRRYVNNNPVTSCGGCWPIEKVMTNDHQLNAVFILLCKSVIRRLAVLEAENRERQQREVAFCSVALFYFILKGVLWMNRNW